MVCTTWTFLQSIQECSSFITSNKYNWKIRCHINCNGTNVLYFLLCNSCNGNPTYTGKAVNFRHKMNNHVATGHPPTNLTTMFLNVVKRTKVLPRQLVLKFILLWKSIIKVNDYVMNLTYIKWDLIQWTANFFTVTTAAVYIKMICIIQTLHYSRNLETRLV